MLNIQKLLSLLVACYVFKISLSVNISTWTTFLETQAPLEVKNIGHLIIMYNKNLVFLSSDKGLTFTNITEQFHSSVENVHLTEIYLAPTDGKYIIFTDTRNNVLFTSSNYAKNFNPIRLNFTPSMVTYCGNTKFTIVVFDEHTKRLYYSNNMGNSFSVIPQRVSKFEWQVLNGVNQNLYIESESTLYYVKGSDFDMAKDVEPIKIPEINYRQFSVVQEFLFLLTEKYEIFLSYRNGPFIVTKFYPKFKFTGFHVATLQENSFKLSLVHGSETRLYSGNYHSNTTTIEFILALRKIVAHVPGITWHDDAVRDNKPFTHFFTVAGFIGVHMANIYSAPLYSKLDNIEIANISTVITLDDGATWKPIGSHRLQLLNEIVNPKTRASIIIALGFDGDAYTEPRTFISNNYGQSWRDIAHGHHKVGVGANGGIIAAVKIQNFTNTLLYSTDYGHNWKSFQFSDSDELNVTDMMSNNSTIFQVIGVSRVLNHPIIITVDFKDIVTNLLGKVPRTRWAVNGKFVITRANEMYKAYCHSLDFECDNGYYRNSLADKCKLDQANLNNYDPRKIPDTCKPGEYYYKSKGYRKLATSVCHKEDSDIYNIETPEYHPDRVPCPVENLKSFVLFSGYNSIYRIDTTTREKQKMSVTSWFYDSIKSVDFDLTNNCLYYSSHGDGIIARQCLDGQSRAEILIKCKTGSRNYTSLSYDAITERLYYIEPSDSAIRALQTSNEKFGQQISIQNVPVEIPAQLIIDPPRQTLYIDGGNLFWRTRIQEQETDGSIILTNHELLLNISYKAVTVDFETEMIYYFGESVIGVCSKTGEVCTTKPVRRFYPTYMYVDNEFIYWNHDTYLYKGYKRGDIQETKIAEFFATTFDMKLIALKSRDRYVDFNKGNLYKQKERDSYIPRTVRVCSANEYKCVTNECIPKKERCNGKFECQYGDDEEFCVIDYKQVDHQLNAMYSGIFGSLKLSRSSVM